MLETFQKTQINEIQTVFLAFFEIKRLGSWACGRMCHKMHIFTAKIAHSAFFTEKVLQNPLFCFRAVKPRILEIENVYRTRLKLHIFIVSRLQTHRDFQFETVSVVFLRLHNFTEIWCLRSVRE